MSNPPITVTRSMDGRLAEIGFDTGTPANALSIEAMQALHDCAMALQRDRDLTAVVLAGRPDRFSLGFDLKAAGGRLDAGLAERRELLSIGPRMCRAWAEIEAFTVAAIEGWCVGGGVALAVSLDLRVVGRSATFYVPEIERGMNMSWGSVPRIVNLVGPAKAKRIVVLAERIGAERALAWGLADEITEDGAAVTQATAMARRAASLPPVSVRMCKQGIDLYANALAQTASGLDRDQYLLAMTGEDYAEGVASFLEKREPRWSGR